MRFTVDQVTKIQATQWSHWGPTAIFRCYISKIAAIWLARFYHVTCISKKAPIHPILSMYNPCHICDSLRVCHSLNSWNSDFYLKPIFVKNLSDRSTTNQCSIILERNAGAISASGKRSQAGARVSGCKQATCGARGPPWSDQIKKTSIMVKGTRSHYGHPCQTQCWTQRFKSC